MPPIDAQQTNQDLQEDFITSGNVFDDLNPEEPEEKAPVDAKLEGDKSAEPKSGDDDHVPPSVQKLLDKYEERSLVQDQTIQYLRGKMDSLGQPAPKDDKKVEDEPLFKMPDRAALQKALGDPDTAVDSLTQMFKDFGDGITARIEKVRSSGEDALSRRDATAQFNTALENDRQEVMKEFGEAANDEDFIREGDKELERIIRLRGGKSYLPGDLYSAASRVHARLQREGKLKEPANENGNGKASNGKLPSLREVTRRVTSDKLDTRPSGNGGNGVPRTLDDIPFESPAEKRAARFTMQRLGVSEADFVKNYIAGQREAQ